MYPINLSAADVQIILTTLGVSAASVNKFQKSGQREVFDVVFDHSTSSILKIIDITPYASFQNKCNMELSEDDFLKECEFEREFKLQRILRELKVSKMCDALPALEIFDELNTFQFENHDYACYFEKKVPGITINRSFFYKEEQDIDSVLDFLLQMVDIVKSMSEANFVHRDLTPRNILVDNRKINVIDAGLAKFEEDETLTRAGSHLGTPRYMSPEQERITTGYSWDFRTDLFPIGFMAIELFLPQTRTMAREEVLDLHFIFARWKDKNSSKKSLFTFSKIITRLSAVERFKRWENIDHLVNIIKEAQKMEE